MIALGQSYDCPGVSEAILKDIDNQIIWINIELWYYHDKMKNMYSVLIR